MAKPEMLFPKPLGSSRRDLKERRLWMILIGHTFSGFALNTRLQPGATLISDAISTASPYEIVRLKMHYSEHMGSHPPTLSSHGQESAYRDDAEPEILPPAPGYGPGYGPGHDSGYTAPHSDFGPPAPVRRRPLWAAAPATYLLVGINCVVFLAMLARGANFWMPTGDQLINWGADNAGYILFAGQWWRIVTAMFLHVGIVHLATNMWCLWNLGLLAEPLMSSTGLFAVYILSGAAGNLLSTLYSSMHPLHDPSGALYFQTGAGASGAVFGIAGALIILLKSRRLPVPPDELKRIRKSVIYFAVLTLVIGFSVNFGGRYTGVYVDNSAHLGGFASGLLFAAPMVPRVGSSRSSFNLRLRAAIVCLVGLLVLFGFFVAKFSSQN
jgi:rhomboid protease GluP